MVSQHNKVSGLAPGWTRILYIEFFGGFLGDFFIYIHHLFYLLN